MKQKILNIKTILKSVLQTDAVSVFRSKKSNLAANETSASLLSENTDLWSGDYKSWSEVEEITNGYNSVDILEKCKTSLLKVKKGEAVYERDSVLFDEIQYSWPLLAGLQRAASENKGKLCVLDFGGSLGSTYYQNKEFLNTLNELQWCIVEQRNFVDCGKMYFEDQELKFFYTVDECILEHNPNVLILSSVLQYLEKPYEWIEKLAALKIPYIIIDRTTFVKSERDILTIQNVPEEIYHASYPAWFFNKMKLLKSFAGYHALASFPSFCDRAILLNSSNHASWSGIILEAD